MSRKTRPICAVLGCVVVLCGLTTRFAEVARGQSSPQGQTIPEPPKQAEAWKPPVSRVPEEFVNAAALLFEQGLSDPRGCEYRVIELTPDHRTHGWVLPAKDGDKQRFAVCWDGLLVPVSSVGDNVDLKKDIRARGNQVEKGEGRLFWSSYIATAFLLRLGEGELASDLWLADNPSPPAGADRPAPGVSEHYLSLAHTWAETQFDDALNNHRNGDDAAALQGFRKLTAFVKVAEAEAKKRGCQLIAKKSFLEQLPELLADQERRKKEGERESIVCVGPGRDPDQKKRIASLILRLDEVNAPQRTIPGQVSFNREPLVLALIREGEPAIEPLLKCFENDRRLTRSIEASGQWGAIRTCKSVHEAAYDALAGILDFSPRKRYDDERKVLAARFREHLEKTKGVPPAERWFQVLADDDFKPSDWYDAARRLLSPDPAFTPQTMVWSNRSVSPRHEERPKLLLESLGGNKAQSVTKLLPKRIERSDASYAVSLALLLAEWEPKAALEPLAELTLRLRQADEYERFVDVIQKRHELGDRQALDEYVAFLRTAHPLMLSDGRANLFKPMADHPDHPGMAKAAQELFADEKSLWLPLLQNQSDEQGKKERGPVHELLPTPLLRQPAFRNAVLKELDDKQKIGSVHLTKDGTLQVDSPFGFYLTNGGSIPTPKEDMQQDFRHCDWCAHVIGEALKCAPRCELYWTEAERDKAVAASKDFLRRQQYDLEWCKETLRLTAPATAAQVENGQAVFSLAGEGTKVRVVPGFQAPVAACWRSDKIESQSKYDQEGVVVQAEEVLQDGQWRRYFGFLGRHRVARVPAEEIDFSPAEPRWSELREWVFVGAGWHARLEVPPLQIEAFDDFPPRLPAEANLTFGLTVRNSCGLDQASPDPAKSLKVRLLYSPETVSRQGALVPKAARETEWLEIKPKPGAKYHLEKSKTLTAAEEKQLATFDLREWFDMSKSGFYRLQLLPTSADKDAAKEIGEIRFSLAAAAKRETK